MKYSQVFAPFRNQTYRKKELQQIENRLFLLQSERNRLK